MSNPQVWQAIAAILAAFAALIGGLYAVVTRPLLSRLDDLRADMNARFEEVNARLARIEAKLDDHGDRITRLEERTSPLRRERP